MELKNILGRQPGPEVAEQLAAYQENLKHKVSDESAQHYCVKRSRRVQTPRTVVKRKQQLFA